MGWIPVRNRQTCCYCLESGDKLILFDAGTGLARFGDVETAGIAEKYDKIYIFLSHYHLDHITGLIYLPLFFRGKEVHIAGPGKGIYKTGVREILNTLTSYPYFARAIEDYPMEMRFHDLGTGDHRLDGLNIKTVLQQHSDPSLGIRLDDAVCYCTDTACSEETVKFVSGCELLMHEVWYDAKDAKGLSGSALKSHSHVEAVAQTALKAGVKRLMLIHLNPAYDDDKLAGLEKQARQIFPNSFLPVETTPLDI